MGPRKSADPDPEQRRSCQGKFRSVSGPTLATDRYFDFRGWTTLNLGKQSVLHRLGTLSRTTWFLQSVLCHIIRNLMIYKSSRNIVYSREKIEGFCMNQLEVV